MPARHRARSRVGEDVSLLWDRLGVAVRIGKWALALRCLRDETRVPSQVLGPCSLPQIAQVWCQAPLLQLTATANEGFDVKQLLSGWDVMSSVLIYTGVHLRWLEVLPEGYLFMVEDLACLDEEAVRELLALQIPVAAEEEDVDITLRPLPYKEYPPGDVSLASLLARVPTSPESAAQEVDPNSCAEVPEAVQTGRGRFHVACAASLRTPGSARARQVQGGAVPLPPEGILQVRPRLHVRSRSAGAQAAI